MTHAEELKSSGLKATLPRIKILDIFQKSTQRHLTAEDVYKLLLAEGADIGLANGSYHWRIQDYNTIHELRFAIDSSVVALCPPWLSFTRAYVR